MLYMSTKVSTTSGPWMDQQLIAYGGTMSNALTTEARRERAENTTNFMTEGVRGTMVSGGEQCGCRRWYLYESGAKRQFSSSDNA